MEEGEGGVSNRICRFVYAVIVPKIKCADVAQAHKQFHADLEREVYIRAPPEFGLPPDVILKVLKTLLGYQSLDYTGISHTEPIILKILE